MLSTTDNLDIVVTYCTGMPNGRYVDIYVVMAS